MNGVDRRAPRAKDLLRGVGVQPSKRKGQNFTIDPSVTNSIIEFGLPSSEEKVLEIGPGLGALTTALRGKGLFAVLEIEEAFCRRLQEQFPELKVYNEDARTFDFSALNEQLTVFGNLPYAFSTEIVFQLLAHRAAIKRAVLLLQREFVERMVASPGGRDYGVLSISCQLLADLRSGPVVPGTCFHPPARVDSQVVELKFLSSARIPLKDIDFFKRVVRSAFHMRRKKISNSMMGSGMLEASRVRPALVRARIDENRRAETLSIEEFYRLAQELAASSDDHPKA